MRIALCSIALVLCVIWFTRHLLEEIWDQYSVKDYIVDSVFYYIPEEQSERPEELEWGDKVSVMARLEEENTDWVLEELPEYAMSLSYPDFLVLFAPTLLTQKS